MLFVLLGKDSPDARRLRALHLQAHLDWVLGVMDRVRIAGPIRDDSGEACASLYVLEAEDESDARAFISQDPYYRSGVWQDVSLQPFIAAAGTWVGGASWLAR